MNDGLIYGISTLAVGLIGLIIRYSFKSKCTDVSICYGLLHIQRSIDAEIEEQKMEGNIGRDNSLKNIGNV